MVLDYLSQGSHRGAYKMGTRRLRVREKKYTDDRSTDGSNGALETEEAASELERGHRSWKR